MRTFAFLAILVSMAAAQRQFRRPHSTKNIVQLAVGTKDLSTLVAALKAGKLVTALEGKGPFTVFAPTNAAFAKLPKATLNHLLEPKNIASLQAVLEYHVVSGAIYSRALKSENRVKTLESEEILVEKNAGGVTINRKSHVTTADVSATNGVVHIIDTVLIPPSMLPPSQTVKNIVNLAAGTKDLSTLVAALKAGKLVTALEGKGPFTVFAPTNEAFAKLPKATLNSLLQPKNIKTLQAVLEYHVVSGAVYSNSLKPENHVKTLEKEQLLIEVRNGGVTINHASHVTTADVAASNGVVHIIDTVLLPPSMTKKSIVELASGNKDLSTLVAALTAGKLVTALEGKGPFTVFAPTNEAFAKLPKATLNSLLEPANIKQLDDVLEYHVVAGAAVYSKDLKSSQQVKTLEGEQLTVTKSWRGVRINGKARVTTADVAATNGVVHIIDTVLVPTKIAHAGSKSIVELAMGTKDLSTLVTALTAGKLVTALEAKGPFTVFAPTNEAFAKLPKATLNSLLQPENIKQLDDVLEYHVVAGAAVYSKDLKSTQQVKTLEGDQLTVQKSWRGVYVNGKSKVTTADVAATNGVVHIVNAVLLPPKKCTIKVPKKMQPEYAFEFAALDKDHNGYLSTAEFKDMGVKLADKFDGYRKKGHTWGRSWGGRRLRSSWLEALQRKMKERADAMRAARVFKKFDQNNSQYISLCEFENAMYKEQQEDGGNSNDGPVVVHG